MPPAHAGVQGDRDGAGDGARRDVAGGSRESSDDSEEAPAAAGQGGLDTAMASISSLLAERKAKQRHGDGARPRGGTSRPRHLI